MQLRPSHRIAVIDDDAVFIDMMRDLLADGEGYEVVSPSRWAQSFEFVKDTQPDLIILDLMLGRDQIGLALLQLLREDAATAHIPVILCSAASTLLRNYVHSTNGFGAVEAVSKPFDVDHLLLTIHRLLPR